MGVISSHNDMQRYEKEQGILTTVNTDRIQLQSKLLYHFGDPGRLRILEALQSGPMTVTEIVAAVHTGRCLTSQT